MIKRTTPRYAESQEPLFESNLNGNKGIDLSKAPTDTESLYMSENLDVDYDGGLVLRKPLHFIDASDSDVLKIKNMYNGHSMHVKQYQIAQPAIYDLILTDIYGLTHTVEYINYSNPTDKIFDFSECNIINTATSTLLTNVKIKLSAFTGYELYNKHIYTDSTITRRCILKCTYNEDYNNTVHSMEHTLELITPEANVLKEDTIALDFNTTLANPLMVRDNYYASQPAIKNILAYGLKNNTVLKRDYSEQLEYNTTLVSNGQEAWATPEEGLVMFQNTDYSIRIFAKQCNRNGKQYVDITVQPLNVMQCLVAYMKIGLYKYSDYSEPFTELWEVPKWGLGTNSKEFTYSFSIPTPFTDTWYYIGFDYEYYSYSLFNNISIDELTESGEYPIITSLDDSKNPRAVCFKAFLDKPCIPLNDVNFDNVVAIWECSINGHTWHTVKSVDSNSTYVDVAMLDENAAPDLTEDKTISWITKKVALLNLPLFQNRSEYGLLDRPDCLIVHLDNTNIQNTIYRCTLYKTRAVPEKYIDESFPKVDGVQVSRVVDFKIGEKTYYLQKGKFETVDTVFKNPVKNVKLYWKHCLYSYSSELKNNIYVSEYDSAIFPMSRIIDLGTFQENTVQKVIPWKDYLIAFTDNNIHLIMEEEIGFTTKLLNTFIGVSELDANTCVSILNGVLFKSGSKIFMLMPNFNSGSDTIFNIAEISKPVNHILENISYHSTYKPFAFTTSEYYYLWIPSSDNTTKCLKYDYSRKIWTFHTYYQTLFDYDFKNLEIVLYGQTGKHISVFTFDKEKSNINTSLGIDYYGDTFVNFEDGASAQCTPIPFKLDSGQKADNVSLTKQFVESKIIVATLTSKDNFKMDVQIDIEGNSFTKHIDLTTSGALLRDSSNQLLTLGTDMDFTENEDTFNTMRQMFLRYAGKGKTIRHIVSGNSLYKFKIHNLFYRFKIPNVKQ